MKKIIFILCSLLISVMLLSSVALADAAVGGEYNFQYVDYDVMVNAPDGYVNGRYGPGLEYGIQTPIYNGVILHVEATQDNYLDGLHWGRIVYEGSYMWISLSQTSPWTPWTPEPETPAPEPATLPPAPQQEPALQENTPAVSDEVLQQAFEEANAYRTIRYMLYLQPLLTDPASPAYQSQMLDLNLVSDPVFPYDYIYLEDVTGDGLKELLITHYTEQSDVSGKMLNHPLGRPDISYTGTDNNKMQVLTIKNNQVLKIYEYNAPDPALLTVIPDKNTNYLFLQGNAEEQLFCLDPEGTVISYPKDGSTLDASKQITVFNTRDHNQGAGSKTVSSWIAENSKSLLP